MSFTLESRNTQHLGQTLRSNRKHESEDSKDATAQQQGFDANAMGGSGEYEVEDALKEDSRDADINADWMAGDGEANYELKDGEHIFVIPAIAIEIA